MFACNQLACLFSISHHITSIDVAHATMHYHHTIHILLSMLIVCVVCLQGFFGSKHFSQANDLLVKQGMPAINWQISS